GLSGAILEFVHSLLGIPHADPSAPAIVQATLSHHLPPSPTPMEIETWTNCEAHHHQILELAVSTKLSLFLQRNPQANSTQKAEVQQLATLE
ncbi:hypothetical protein CROQUDRAFT_10826, partial [Cronartium quercuum f. sp. fusiforme G11]